MDIRRFTNIRPVFLALGLLLVPALAHAQATLAGIVRDTSGAVLPGVTVEAASPALIEKVRSAVSDDRGQYRLSELRPVIIALSLLEPRSSDEDSRLRMRSPLVRSPLLMRSLSSAVSREPSAGSILDLRFWSM